MASVVDVDDHSSDAHDTLEDDQDEEQPRGIEEVEIENGDAASGNMAIEGVKLSTERDKDDNSPLLESSRGPSLSTTAEHASDIASTHSLPVVHVSEPEAAPARQTHTATTSWGTGRLVPPPPENTAVTRRNAASAEERRQRHRSAIEVRSSNRLSGFFTNLIHRGNHLPSGPSRNTIQEDQANSPTTAEKPDSRASSPPPTRPTTPPPPLPAPSLRDLGLSLSVVTSDLSPSHFSTPPSSGAFLAPHYLLLCHAQGLDVLPLVSPPQQQPYALVRRVSFKSVVVMEQRGVLVAIAGRRDGVRVYALEEVKKAVEWRIEVELRRERDRQRRETIRKITIGALLDPVDFRDSSEKNRKANSSTPPPGGSSARAALLRKGSYPDIPLPPTPTTPPAPLIPRTPTIRTPKPPARRNPPVTSEQPRDGPPPYSRSLEASPPRLRDQASTLSVSPSRSRGNSIADVLTAAPISRRNTEIDVTRAQDPDTKPEWVESSDDEAIDIVAAGSSGSQALDERTSARSGGNATLRDPPPVGLPSSPPILTHARTPSAVSRRNRPANLDLTLSRTNTAVPPEPSPVPTLLTLRQALSHSSPTSRDIHAAEQTLEPDTPFGDGEDDDDEADGAISLTQALMESRIPDLPPPGSTRAQQPILLTSSHPVATGEDEPSSPRTSEAHSTQMSESRTAPAGRRRRWSVLIGQSAAPSSVANGADPSSSNPPATAPGMRERTPNRLSRSYSYRSNHSATSTVRPPSSLGEQPLSTSPTSLTPAPPLPALAPSIISANSARHSRFIPRIISSAFQGRRSEDRPSSASKGTESDGSRKATSTPPPTQSPPPKLEYVKLPGTKGALVVKAVETAKKSFLAILCGENGEKVELFAGTYRTALGLSRTFILPDSPRSLELQLQGDDLVEVFLVFSQNVFGLEPATVRVREVRIGRAERRAARRRVREIRTGDVAGNNNNDSEAQLAEQAEEDGPVSVSVSVSVAVGSTVVATGSGQETPPLIAAQHPDQQPADRILDTNNSDSNPERPTTPAEPGTASALAHAEELVALATARLGPYTTFQQLSFAPNFPLASIADEYIIPPTYPDFLDYRAVHEPDASGSNTTDFSQVQFSPPGLPVPTPSAPSTWYYRDPKNVVHGPWNAELMQGWYDDGLLPLDLPIRRTEDPDFMLLKDLRLQCVDPSHPFRSPSALPSTQSAPSTGFQASETPLLAPISLLSQPRHFGPPALFYSSRGGHSTTIVDARGRSVLKGRFMWTGDERDDDTKLPLAARMGDVKRLEAFDVEDRAVLVAMRQGGLEAVDLGDALLKPGDDSRTTLPQFNPPPSSVNRRGPYIWKIGTPVSSSPASTAATILSSKSKGGYTPHIPGKKLSTSSNKSPAGRTEFNPGESEIDQDEVLFLGRKDDEIYICERNQGAFRILRLCPNR